jgi:hypothetical protein
LNLCILLLTFYDHSVFTDAHSFSTAIAFFKTAPFLRKDMACKLLKHLTSFEYLRYVDTKEHEKAKDCAYQVSVMDPDPELFGQIGSGIGYGKAVPDPKPDPAFLTKKSVTFLYICSVVLFVFSYIHISLENLINVLTVLLQSFDIYLKITCKFQGRIRIPEADPDPELPGNQYPDQDYTIPEPQTLEPITIVFVSGI